MSAPPIRDSVEKGRIYPFFVMQHTVKPELQQFSLYQHAGDLQWSSLAPISRMKEPVEAVQFFREQLKYGIRVSQSQEMQLFGGGPTRALCCLSNDERDSLAIFRMMDDGSLWHETATVADDHNLREKAIDRAADCLKHVLAESGSNRYGNVHRLITSSNSPF